MGTYNKEDFKTSVLKGSDRCENTDKRDEVTETLDELYSQIAILDEVSRNLENKLEAVLIPNNEKCEICERKAYSTVLASRIANNVDSVMIARQRLQSLIDRTQLPYVSKDPGPPIVRGR